MGALARELTLHKRPLWLLRLFMNALESKRMAQRRGWSRPWNKVGVMIFRSHYLKPERDAPLFAEVGRLLDGLGEIPEDCQAFVRSLLGEETGEPLMAFAFYHTRREGKLEYEGVTLSLGRKVEGDRTKRDRLDLILEDLREDGAVDQVVDQVRVVINPWSRYQSGDVFELHLDPTQAQALYTVCLADYARWRDVEERQWDHWSSRYIDYFGPRSFIPRGSGFV